MRLKKISKYSAFLVILVILLSLGFLIVFKKSDLRIKADVATNYLIMPFGANFAPEWRSFFKGNAIRAGNAKHTPVAGGERAWKDSLISWARLYSTLGSGGWTKIYLSGPATINGTWIQDGVSLPWYHDDDGMLAQADLYSQAAAEEPLIYELSMDDFMSNVGRTLHPGLAKDGQALPDESAASVSSKLDQITDKIHNNSNVKFGITLYEDNLLTDSKDYRVDTFVGNGVFSEHFRGGIDVIHLYIHYRANASRFEEAVNLAKSYFPNAQIIAGSYAYDRIDYINCDMANAGTVTPEKKCTEIQEKQYFSDAITKMANLVSQGQIAGIEFWPSYFGIEKTWPDLDRSSWCSDTTRCVANTKLMRQKAVSILYQYFPEINLIGMNKTVNSINSAPGAGMTYNISAVNLSDQNFRNFRTNDILPVGVSYLSGSANNNGQFDGNQIVWNLSNFAAGQSINLSFNAIIDPVSNITAFTNYTSYYKTEPISFFLKNNYSTTQNLPNFRFLIKDSQNNTVFQSSVSNVNLMVNGTYDFRWDQKNSSNQYVQPGIYSVAFEQQDIAPVGFVINTELGSDGHFTFLVGTDNLSVFFLKTGTIRDAIDNFYGKNSKHIPIGNLIDDRPGKSAYDSQWSWHLDPLTTIMAQTTIELCDGTPSYVEANLDQWLATVHNYCPWAAQVMQLY